MQISLSQNHNQASSMRNDIQVLRGLAVLWVLLHHSRVLPVQAGYLGVDIFFVISGYLITRMIAKEISDNTFRFSHFYFRRAKRLLPAASLTFLTVALIFPHVLVTTDLKDFASQLLGAVTFTGNIVLWRQSGYFGTTSEYKPLLHVWSLSIEEQYYLILPALLFFIRKRFWLFLTGTALITSFLLCLYLAPSKPNAAFFLLPTRGWELAIGSVIALFEVQNKNIFLKTLFWPALLTLIVIPLFPFSTPHPGLNALLVCLATGIIICRRHQILEPNAATKVIASIGDFSYSLYLVHWPIFAFLNNVYPGLVPNSARYTGFILALLQGYLLYQFIERPIRQMQLAPAKKWIGSAIVISLMLIMIPFAAIHFRKSLHNYDEMRRANFGFADSCDFTDNFTVKKECQSSKNPTVLIWGDSYAMHLVTGIAKTIGTGVIQATRNLCGPFVGLSPTLAASSRNRHFNERCIEFNDSVMTYLSQTPEIKTVVMSSPFGYFIEADPQARSLIRINGQLNEQYVSMEHAVSSMLETAKKIRGLGKNLIIISPPPTSGFDIGKCLESKMEGILRMGENKDCTIPRADYENRQERVLSFLQKLEDAHLPVIWLSDALCSQKSCMTESEGIFIYRDTGHLSYDGSLFVAKKIDIKNLLLEKTR